MPPLERHLAQVVDPELQTDVMPVLQEAPLAPGPLP